MATANDVNSTIRRVLDETLPELPYGKEVFDQKVQLVFDHVLSAYEDATKSAYTRRPGYTRTVGGVVEYDGSLDVDRIADDVVARIKSDADFAARIAAQLRGEGNLT